MQAQHNIIQNAEPFLLPGSRVGVLLIHGFTGTPRDMRWLGNYLHATTHCSVLGIRLAGHATHPEDMIRSNYTDWLASVEDGVSLLSGFTDQIFVMGLSMGGALALTTATYLPLNGVVTMSTPFKLPDDPRLRHIDWLSRISAFMPKSSHSPDADWFDKEAYKEHISYPQNPVRSIGELNKLLHLMQTNLPEIKIPVLSIHSHDDHYVLKDSMPNIHALLTTKEKNMLWIEGSSHNMTLDAKKETVAIAAVNFVKRFEQ